MRGDINEKLSRPDSKAGGLQRASLNLYLEHLRDGALPTSGKFLFYELDDRGVVDEMFAPG